MKAEYRKGCLQRDSVERKEDVGVQSAEAREGNKRDSAETLLDEILSRRNLNQAYDKVKSKKGAPGIDGMTVGAALPWLMEHGKELKQSIREGRYKPNPVRQVMIPKPNGSGERKLGIPKWQAYQWGNSRQGYWRIAGSPVLTRSMTNEKLASSGYFDILKQYEQLTKKHLND